MLLQALAQQLPPIYVTVRQPTGAIPQWAVALISAGIGAVLSITSTIVMEFVKPHIANRRVRAKMVPLIQTEFAYDLWAIESALRLLGEAEKGGSQSRLWSTVYSVSMASGLLFDRFDHFFGEEKTSFSEMDIGMALSSFYRGARALAQLPFDAPYANRTLLFKIAAATGRRYCELAKFTFSPIQYPVEDYFREAMLKADSLEKDNATKPLPSRPDSVT